MELGNVIYKTVSFLPVLHVMYVSDLLPVFDVP